MLIKRHLTKEIRAAAREFPVVAIVGPRQSGKTTLARMIFAKHKYVSLEDYDVRTAAMRDPRAFLAEYPTKQGLILDEIQHAPQLLSYMQTKVDLEQRNGFFVVTGSQNFLVDQTITQTLAGRMALFTLLPLSIDELGAAKLLPEKAEALVFNGCYPKIYARRASPLRLYKNYLRLYLERDVRQIKNVSDLRAFQDFMRLCAGRVGQILNLSSLGNDCGITHNTARAWLSLLEASYIVFLLRPYFKNFGKRLIKAPKLYFFDTGIICSLLNIRSVEELREHYLRGSLVENLIIADMVKQQYNTDVQPSIYFWRDQTGHEIDGIIDVSSGPVPVEIKAGQTVTDDFFKNIEYWQQLAKSPTGPAYVVYGGAQDFTQRYVKVLGWQSAGKLIK